MLLGIVDRATSRLEAGVELHEERAEANAAELANRLSFDASEDGERLRRFQMYCGRSLFRAVDALMGAPHKAWPALKRALEWATAALCAEMVGGAQKVLETSTDYAKTRHQFGKPIGIYQAVSHKLADMLVLSESGRSATYYAAWAVEADAPDRSLASSMAKAYVSDAYRKVAGDGIQVHGGIGFTWEHDMHLYFKRAKASEVTLGDATYHRELVAQALDL